MSLSFSTNTCKYYLAYVNLQIAFISLYSCLVATTILNGGVEVHATATADRNEHIEAIRGEGAK